MTPDEMEDSVRRFMDTWQKRDLGRALEFTDPEIEIDWSTSLSPFKGVYRGRDGFEQFWRDQLETWDEFRPELVERIECGPERLITVNVIRARGGTSGIEVNARGAVLWVFREQKLVAAKLFQTRDEALREVGAAADGEAAV
jgi:ketosteroid isomerase-like protein